MHKSRSEYISFFALFAVAAVLLFFVLAPFFTSLALAAVAAALLHKPYEKLSRALFGHKNIAALIMLLGLILFLIIPVFYFGATIFHEAVLLYNGGTTGSAYTQALSTAIEKPIQHLYPAFRFNVSAYVSTALSFVAANLAGVVSGALFFVFQTFLMLLAFSYFLREGTSFVASIKRVSPFGKEQTNDVLHTMYVTIQSVIKGTFLVALIRWVCVSAAFYAFGIPNALLWGSLGGIIGAIPGVGAFVVFVPAVAYLYLQGSIPAAALMALIGILVIVLIDNMLTPYFFGKDLALPSIFILFSILGGILYFGPAGFILGPLVLVVFSSLVKTYPQIVLDREAQ